jgi:hypothetical protein
MTVELVTWVVEGIDCRLDVVPVFRVGVLIDDCLAALAKAGDVVDRCQYGPPQCLDDPGRSIGCDCRTVGEMPA